MKPPRIIIVDYDKDRIAHLSNMISFNFPGSVVAVVSTRRPGEGQSLDTGPLSALQSMAPNNDLMIGHIGGNPSGYECLKVFKRVNPRGKAVLYTKAPSISLKDLEGLKLADRVFQRSSDDSQVFKDAGEMMDVIRGVIESPGVGYIKSRLKDPAFLALLTAFFTLLAAVVGLMATIFKR